MSVQGLQLLGTLARFLRNELQEVPEAVHFYPALRASQGSTARHWTPLHIKQYKIRNHKEFGYKALHNKESERIVRIM